MRLTIPELLGVFVDRAIKPILTGIQQVLQNIADLQTAVAALQANASPAATELATLKGKLDGAIADNVAKAAQISTLTAQVADLTAKLAASGTAIDPAIPAAVDAVTVQVKTISQALADATAANAPSN